MFDTARKPLTLRCGRARRRRARRTGGPRAAQRQRHDEHEGSDTRAAAPETEFVAAAAASAEQRRTSARGEKTEDQPHRADQPGLGRGLLEGVGRAHARRPPAGGRDSDQRGEHRACRQRRAPGRTDGHLHVLGRDAAVDSAPPSPRARARRAAMPTAEATSADDQRLPADHRSDLLGRRRDGAQQRDLALALQHRQPDGARARRTSQSAARGRRRCRRSRSRRREPRVLDVLDVTARGAGHDLGRVRPAARAAARRERGRCRGRGGPRSCRRCRAAAASGPTVADETKMTPWRSTSRGVRATPTTVISAAGAVRGQAHALAWLKAAAARHAGVDDELAGPAGALARRERVGGERARCSHGWSAVGWPVGPSTRPPRPSDRRPAPRCRRSPSGLPARPRAASERAGDASALEERHVVHVLGAHAGLGDLVAGHTIGVRRVALDGRSRT